MTQCIARIVATAALVALTLAARAADIRTLMAQIGREHGVGFVYDAELPLSADYRGPQLDGLALDEQLRRLFAHSGIAYRVEGRQVLLMRQPVARTLSGYVTDADGEPLINATVFDLTSRQGTTTNARGHYSLTVGAGPHDVRFSYVGHEPLTLHIDLAADLQRDVRLQPVAEAVGEVTIEGDLNSPLLTTQTGRRTLTPHELQTEFALMSSPDVVKRLQSLSGVSQGIELLSGLYVHGGGADENLFLLDGTPLYQTNHALGLFSSFNTDVIKNVDFYKSGFPARYGGRLSSVVDVRTADGDMERWHGLYGLGLIDGRVQAGGPLRRGRTSLNVGLRRTWSDLVMRPVFAIVNRRHSTSETTLSYFFHDLNAKLTHVVDSQNKLQLSFYSGTDRFDVSDQTGYSWTSNDRQMRNTDRMTGLYSWGNDNVALSWLHRFGPRLFADMAATYSHNRSRYHYTDDDNDYGPDGQPTSVFHNEHRYRSTIDDLGLRTDMDYRPTPAHHVRFGASYAYHLFRPQTRATLAYYGEQHYDTLQTVSRNRQPAHELTAYAEDEMRIARRWSLNLGLHADLFSQQGHPFLTLDPRVATKWQLGRRTSAKASYTWMTQQMHRLQNTFIDLPTDYWVPTTRRVAPMRSQQLSVGLYHESPRRHWLLMAEAYAKRSRGLLQYSSWIGLEPPADAWDRLVEQGRGRAVGLDLDVGYRSRRVEADAAYTLSRTERRFAGVYDGWFPDKFDNRHKLNLALRLRLGHSEMQAAWTFHTGNRITVPEHFAATPVLPDGTARRAYELLNAQLFYTVPNNLTLPAYHRLDLGWNFRHTTRAGHERIWNVSIYNAYCRMNPLYAEVRQNRDEQFEVKSVGFVPIIPSVSYTIKF